MTVPEAMEVLGVEPAAVIEVVYREGMEAAERKLRELARQRYRERIMAAHPDRGGDHTLAAKLNEAREIIARVRIGREPPRRPRVVVNVWMRYTAGGYGDATSSGSWTATTNTGVW
jgi:hypothetical protein